jgi:membrane dipeptidase
MDVAEAPFVFSHNGCAAIHEHPRNLSDEQLRGCAQTGGVVGILAIPLFLTGERSAPFEDFLRHLLHAIEVAGVEHVGLGLDHWYGTPPYADLIWPAVDPRADDGVSNLREIFWDEPALAGQDVVEGEVEGLGTPAGAPLISAALLDRGLSETEVAGVMGGNWLRILAATWR